MDSVDMGLGKRQVIELNRDLHDTFLNSKSLT